MMAGELVDPGSLARAGDDLVEPRRRQRLATSSPLEDHEDPLDRRGRGALDLEIGRQGRKEAGRDRHDAFVTALALGDEQPLFAGANVTQAQSEHLAAPKASQQHRLDHGAVALSAQSIHKRVDLVGVDDARQGARRPDQRHTSNGLLARPANGKPTRHRVARGLSIAPNDQVVI